VALPNVAAVGAVASGTGAITPALPVGWAQNDILLLIAETANQNFTTFPPTGWTAVSNPPTGIGTAGGVGALKLHLAWKRAGSSESAPALGDSGDHQIARIVAIRGCVTSGDPWITTATQNFNPPQSSVTWPSLTTSGNQNLIIYALGGNRDANSTADVSSVSNGSGAVTSITPRVSNWVTSGAGGGIWLGEGAQDTGGATGTTTATITSQSSSIWTGALQAATSYAQADSTATYSMTEAVRTNAPIVTYNILEGEPNAWFTRFVSGSNNWVESSSAEPGTLTAAQSSPVNTYNVQSGELTAVDPQDSPVVTYDVFGEAYQDTPHVLYQVFSSVGDISGGGSLPWASVQADAAGSYRVVVGVEADQTVTYRVIQSPENSATITYTVKGYVEQDSAIAEYDVLGPATTDVTATYQVIAAAEQDSATGSYDVVAAVEQDSATVTYVIVTNPNTVAQNAEVTYDVVNAVAQSAIGIYRVLGGAEADVSAQYAVKGEAVTDIFVAYDLGGAVSEDITCEYQIIAATEVLSDTAVVYNVLSSSRTIPNVIGLPLPKARKTLEQAGFVLGQITYQ
jgi:hypothetical protein